MIKYVLQFVAMELTLKASFHNVSSLKNLRYMAPSVTLIWCENGKGTLKKIHFNKIVLIVL